MQKSLFIRRHYRSEKIFGKKIIMLLTLFIGQLGNMRDVLSPSQHMSFVIIVECHAHLIKIFILKDLTQSVVCGVLDGRDLPEFYPFPFLP